MRRRHIKSNSKKDYEYYELIRKSRENLDANVKELLGEEESELWSKHFLMNTGLAIENKKLNYIKSRYWNILNTKMPEDVPSNVDEVLAGVDEYIGDKEAHIRMMLIDYLYQKFGYAISKNAKDYPSIRGELIDAVKSHKPIKGEN